MQSDIFAEPQDGHFIGLPARLFRIWEVPGSNVDLKTSYPDGAFVALLSNTTKISIYVLFTDNSHHSLLYRISS